MLKKSNIQKSEYKTVHRSFSKAFTALRTDQQTRHKKRIVVKEHETKSNFGSRKVSKVLIISALIIEIAARTYFRAFF